MVCDSLQSENWGLQTPPTAQDTNLDGGTVEPDLNSREGGAKNAVRRIWEGGGRGRKSRRCITTFSISKAIFF